MYGVRKEKKSLSNTERDSGECDMDDGINTNFSDDHEHEMQVDGALDEQRQQQQQHDEAPSAAKVWKETLERVVPAVVVLRVVNCRAFDTESPGSSYATGFVVDKERGIILTNRHVTKPSPTTTDAIFLNREEVSVTPIYRDPVHDFGFLRFDTSQLNFMEPVEIPLRPDLAQMGLEVRVVGNDSGEKLSILAGTIARLDRDAPHYSKSGYNDFNTWYLQAASGTKGGSSGSPVIDNQGNAVGLNAGSKTKSSTAFFLPLQRVVRALRLLQKSLEPIPETGLRTPPIEAFAIPRGTIRTTWLYKGFDEARRLGLDRGVEAEMRKATTSLLMPLSDTPKRSLTQSNNGSGSSNGYTENGTGMGMLVVDGVVPGGEADGILQPGDLLFRMNKKIMATHLDVETLLDASIASTVKAEVVRGGQAIEVDLPVGDLHAITPDRFLQYAGGVVHALSYQQARNFLAKCGLVYVADPGFVLSRANVPKHAILTKLNGIETPTIEAFCAVLKTLKHGERVPLCYYVTAERHRTETVVMEQDTKWYGEAKFWKRNDTTGLWDARGICEAFPGVDDTNMDRSSPAAADDPAVMADDQKRKEDEANEAAPPVSTDAATTAPTTHTDVSRDGTSATHAPNAREDKNGKAVLPFSSGAGERIMNATVPSLVVITAIVPPVGLADGVHSKSFEGCGVVVWHNRDTDVGIILTDRNTVAISSCDVSVSFGAFPCEVPARVEFLHPVHNFAMISYTVSSLSPRAAEAVRVASLSHKMVSRGDQVHLVGLSSQLQPSHRVSTVTNVAGSLFIRPADVPRYRAINFDAIELDNDFGRTFSGILTDDESGIVALWASFAKQVKGEEREFIRGIPSTIMLHWISKVAAHVESQSERRIRTRHLGSTDANGSGSAGVNITDTDIPAPVVEKRHLSVPVFDAELEPVQLAKAATFRLPEHWIETLSACASARKQVLRVKGLVAGSQAAKVLAMGDMILTVDGTPIDCFHTLETIVSKKAIDEDELLIRKRKRDADEGEAALSSSSSSSSAFDVLAFRAGAELRLRVEPSLESACGTRRLVHWCGAMLQEPHRAVRELGFEPEGASGVYVSRWYHGSPAHRYGLYALHWIVEVNGKKTPDLDSFLAAVRGLKHRDFVVIRLVHLNTKPKLLTLRLDLHYWPPCELVLNAENVWERRTLETSSSS